MNPSIENAWKNFKWSSPKNADEDNFAFIVHAIDPSGKSNEETMLCSMQARDYRGLDPSQQIDLFLEPHRISEKKQISCSVIGKNKAKGYEALQTFKPFGLILKVPFQNIVDASKYDLASCLGYSDKELDERGVMLNVTPQDLLSGDGLVYNEVIVRGKTKYGSVEIEGVFMNPNDGHGLTEFEYFSLARPAAKLVKKIGENDIFELPKQESKMKDTSIFVGKSSLFKNRLYSIEMVKNGRIYIALTSYKPIKFYCQNGWADLRQKMTEEEFKIFMGEIPNLSKEAHTKYKDILQSLPQQYERFKNTKEQSLVAEPTVRRDIDGEPFFSLSDTLKLMRQNNLNKEFNNKSFAKSRSPI